MIITSTGKNVVPALVENLIKEYHLISHAPMVEKAAEFNAAPLKFLAPQAERR